VVERAEGSLPNALPRNDHFWRQGQLVSNQQHYCGERAKAFNRPLISFSRQQSDIRDLVLSACGIEAATAQDHG
jgi:hypothetical protein